MTARRLAQAVQRGATRLEIFVVLIIAAILSSWLLHTLRFYEELTEKTVVESTIVNLRSGLRFKIADLIIKGRGEQQQSLAGANPVSLLEHPPKGYLGEMRGPGNLPPGSWYYEQDRSELVYIPNLRANLSLAEGAQPEVLRLRWQLKAGEEGGGHSVDIELLTPYHWF
ncbi:MAG: hypothetical protein WAV95_12695 [Azonexus sp.]